MRRSRWIVLRGTFFLLLPFWLAFKFVVSGDYRSQLLTRIRNRGRAHQLETTTRFDRYPELFAASSSYFSGQDGIRILSFGCSTGEEVATLGKYFPTAEILGADVNRRSIRICKKRFDDPRLKFALSDSELIGQHAPFHAIFCLAVLQRAENWPIHVTDSSRIYPFESFDRQLTELDQWLAWNGLLVIDNTDYLFNDATVYKNYEPLPGSPGLVNRLQFDRHNKRFQKPQYNDRIFVKKS